MNYLLEVNNLCKNYREFRLKDVSFKLPAGYIMGFIGPNGAGKSTTIKSIMGYINIDGGEIKVLGETVSRSDADYKQKIGYVGEEQYFIENMTVGWTLNFVSKFYATWDDKLSMHLLKKYNISPSKKIRELSKGMRVKLSLMIALAHRPQLLILDEPTSGLDPLVRKEILDEFMEFVQDEKHGVFFSSHITEDISRIADYVTYINNGEIILSDEKDKLLSRWKKVKVDIKYVDEEVKENLRMYAQNAFYYTGITGDVEQFKTIMKRKYPGAKIEIDNISLDDVLMSLVEVGKHASVSI